MTIRVLIDGSDLVRVRGDKVWFEHISRSLPGTWVGDTDYTGNEPTIVNGGEWVPQWDGRISNAYTAEAGCWPAERDVHVSVSWVSARGRVVKVEQPSEDNDYTFTMMLDDVEQPGAAWYEVQLLW